MKTSIITAIIASLTLLGTSPEGEARPHRGHHNGNVYVSGYRSCGTPIYQQRYITHYKHCGKPVWKNRYVAPPRAHYYHRPVCPPPVRICPPPVPVCPPTYYHGGYPRNGVVIQGTFRL
jgi:hypothetical protein